MPSNLVLVRPEEVPSDLVCSICLSFPVDPYVSTCCNHVFCKDCIKDPRLNDQCPQCRTYCPQFGVKLLRVESPLLNRIYCGIPVRCEHHAEGCVWTGSAPDYLESHRKSCSYNCEKRKSAPAENTSSRALLEEANEKIRRLEARNNDLEREKEQLLSRLRVAERTIERPSMNPSGGGYAYDRHTVVRLTKLICQNLEDKPPSVNSNKIFECVKNIFTDLQKDYRDNPEHFYIDVRMLVAVCLASTWFSPNQRNRIEDMSQEKDWS